MKPPIDAAYHRFIQRGLAVPHRHERTAARRPSRDAPVQVAAAECLYLDWTDRARFVPLARCNTTYHQKLRCVPRLTIPFIPCTHTDSCGLLFAFRRCVSEIRATTPNVPWILPSAPPS